METRVVRIKDIDEIVEAVKMINADYAKQSRAARMIARDSVRSQKKCSNRGLLMRRNLRQHSPLL